MDKYLYFAALLPVLTAERIHDRIILQLLRMDDVTMNDLNQLSAHRASESRFIEDLSKLKLKEPYMSEIWRKLLQDTHPMRMSSLDWNMYGPILHTLPSDVLSMINVTDPDVLEYFGTELTLRQVATFGDRLRSEFGAELLSDEERMTRMGNLLCGFNAADLFRIPFHTFRVLLNREVFKNIPCCSSDQLRSLLLTGLKYKVFGPPPTWNSKTVNSLGYLIAGLDASQIRKIRDDSVNGITPKVIRSIPVNVLKSMRPEQLKALEAPSLLAWRRQTRDVTYLLSSAVSTTAITLTSSLIYLSSHIAADSVLICGPTL